MGAFEEEVGNVRLTARKASRAGNNHPGKRETVKFYAVLSRELGCEAKAGRIAGTTGKLTLRAARAQHKGSVRRALEQQHI